MVTNFSSLLFLPFFVNGFLRETKYHKRKMKNGSTFVKSES